MQNNFYFFDNYITILFSIGSSSTMLLLKIFSYKGNDVTIRTSNLDNTFRYLENIFNNSIVEELPIENKMVI